VTWAPLLRWLGTHAVPGLERAEPDAGRHTRLVPAPGGPALVTVTLGPGPEVAAELTPARPADRAAVVAALRRWLDLDADPLAVDAALGAHPRLAPLVAARPGIRRPGSTDGFATAVLTILGQGVSVAAARTFAARLVAAWGRPGPGALAAFPTPEALAGAGAGALRRTLGITRNRARAIAALAGAAADGLRLEPGPDPGDVRARLLAVPGVGEWTAEYVALLALGDADAFPAGDLVLRRALGARTTREVAALAETWRPWRGYGLVHLWADAFARAARRSYPAPTTPARGR
jgi:3-methyladenine DNA glycosylase/8-oxoguanine DNA glycosylase